MPIDDFISSGKNENISGSYCFFEDEPIFADEGFADGSIIRMTFGPLEFDATIHWLDWNMFTFEGTGEIIYEE